MGVGGVFLCRVSLYGINMCCLALKKIFYLLITWDFYLFSLNMTVVTVAGIAQWHRHQNVLSANLMK